MWVVDRADGADGAPYDCARALEDHAVPRRIAPGRAVGAVLGAATRSRPLELLAPGAKYLLARGSPAPAPS